MATFEKEFPKAVRIPVTAELISQLFTKRKINAEVIDGLPQEMNFKVVGVIQDHYNGCFYFLLAANEVKEGDIFVEFIPTFIKKEDCIDKQRVKKAINKMRENMRLKELCDEMEFGEYLSVKINGKEPADWLLKELEL